MNSVFRKIGNDQTLSQKIVFELQKAILEKEFEPGDKLPSEAELCELFGVSRTALREAVQVLSSKGLVRIKKGSGIYVNEYSIEDATRSLNFYLELNFDVETALHYFEVRELIEPYNARLAARNSDPELIEDLEYNLRQLKRARDNYERSRIDGEFHLRIAEACCNQIIPLIMHPIIQLMPRIKEMVDEKLEYESRAVEEHGQVIELIREGNEDQAETAMREHLARAKKDVNTLVEMVENGLEQ